MEDSIRLTGVEMPDELLVLEWCSRAHHAIDPLWIPQTLVHGRRAVIEKPVHVEIVRSGRSVSNAHRIAAYTALTLEVGLCLPLLPPQLLPLQQGRSDQPSKHHR